MSLRIQQRTVHASSVAPVLARWTELWEVEGLAATD